MKGKTVLLITLIVLAGFLIIYYYRKIAKRKEAVKAQQQEQQKQEAATVKRPYRYVPVQPQLYTTISQRDQRQLTVDMVNYYSPIKVTATR